MCFILDTIFDRIYSVFRSLIILSGHRTILIIKSIQCDSCQFDYIQKSDLEEKNVKQVLQKIVEVRDHLKRTKPSFFKQFLQLF